MKHVNNSKKFAQEACEMSMGQNDELRSYDVSALFTSMPVDKALNVFMIMLEADDMLKDRTLLEPGNIIKLTSLCFICVLTSYTRVSTTYRSAYGPPIVCNLHMEYLEQKALTTAKHPPNWWRRYVNDIHTVLKKEHAQDFSDRSISFIDEDILA